MSSSRSSLPSSSKKRKLSSLSQEAEDKILKDIQSYEKTLTTAVSNNTPLSALVDLLKIALNASNAHHVLKAIYALYRIFVIILSNGMMNSKGYEETDEAKAVRTWLNERMKEYTEILCGLLQDEEAILRTSSLQILFSIQKHLSTSLTTHSTTSSSSNKPSPQYHLSHFRKVISALLTCPPSTRTTASSSKKLKLDEPSHWQMKEDVRDTFLDTWLNVYDDVRWFFLRESGTLLSNSDALSVPVNLLSMLEKLSTFPTDPRELNAWWVEELGAKPPTPKKTRNRKGLAIQDESNEDEEQEGKPTGDDDDWRKFFDEPIAEFDSKENVKPKSARVHTLTLHQSVHSLASHRAVFTRCWMALLSRLSSAATRDKHRKRGSEGRDQSDSKSYALRVLNVLHQGVLPHLTRPVLIMDWVAGCVDYGGTVGLLALNALFTLMKEYNLDYPAFYTRLYAFLDRDVLHLKYRARFFRLAELFLSSTHLPAALVAAFAKRLARLSLNAPPAAVVMLVPFTYNLLKRHPACMAMIHRPLESMGHLEDLYDDEETNPQQSYALDSSLWELHTHVNHYHPVVATLASVLEEAFTRPQYTMEDFLDHTYGTMYETEGNRRIKKEPAVEDMNLASADGTSVVEELWTF